jgi:prepilin-type N-terminal cleavage/methylation domain-containing protein
MSRKLGFTLVEIMIVVAIIGLLAAIAIPSFMKARTTSQKNACIENIRQIEGGKEQWAMEANKKTGDDIVTTAVAAYIKGGVFPGCPASGTYTYNVVGTDVACSITEHKL